MAQPGTSAAFLRELEQFRTTLVRDRHGTTGLYIKGLILAAAFIVCWSIIAFFLPQLPLLATACGMALGLVIALIGFNVFHDVGHRSFFKTPKMNKFMHWPLGVFLGASIVIWNPQHNLHHRHPNSETDTDIDVPGVRMHQGQPWRWYHRFQVFYAFLIYSLGYFAWIGRDIYRSTTNRVGTVEIGMKWKDKVALWIQKALYLGLVVTPIIVMNGSAAILPLVAMYLTAGIVLALVFQCAHVVEVSEFPNTERYGLDRNAEHQLRTTVDFSTGNGLSSRIFRWFVGGLNFQVLHHLRPDISHVHYAKLHASVQGLARKYGLPYRQMSYLQALWSHIVSLHRNGRKPVLAA
jgi:linoleoyl-CoA desaturase